MFSYRRKEHDNAIDKLYSPSPISDVTVPAVLFVLENHDVSIIILLAEQCCTCNKFAEHSSVSICLLSNGNLH